MTGWANAWGSHRGQRGWQNALAVWLCLGLIAGCTEYEPAPLPPGMTTIDTSSASAEPSSSAASQDTSSQASANVDSEASAPPAARSETLENASTFKPRTAAAEEEPPAMPLPKKQTKPRATGRHITTFPRRHAQFIRPYTHSKCIVLDDHVLNTASEGSGKAVTIEERFATGKALRAISPDGRFFAFVKQVEVQRDVQWFIEVLDTTTGAPLHSFPVVEKDGRWQTIAFLEFTKHNNLLAIVGGHRGGSLWLWDVAKGKRLRKYPAAALATPFALAEDGSRIIAHVSGTASIFDMVKGKVVGQLETPPQSSGANSIRQIAFSPDKSEIAGLCGGKPTPILVIWDVEGKVKEEFALPSNVNIQSQSFDWLRDGSGWIIDKSLVSRQTRSVVWRVEAGFANAGGLYDDLSVLFYSDFHEPHNLVAVEIPHQKIKEALASVEGEKRVLGPGDNVAIKIAIGDLRFAEKDQIETALGEAISKRLEKMGFKFGEPARATLLVSYTEKAGKKMNKPDMSPVDLYMDDYQIKQHIQFGGEAVLKKYEALGLAKKTGADSLVGLIHFEVKTGRHLVIKGTGESALVETTASTCDLSIFKEGAEAPAWATRLTSNVSPSEQNGADPQTLRQNTFKSILESMSREEIPSMIGDNPDAPTLPLIEDAEHYFQR